MRSYSSPRSLPSWPERKSVIFYTFGIRMGTQAIPHPTIRPASGPWPNFQSKLIRLGRPAGQSGQAVWRFYLPVGPLEGVVCMGPRASWWRVNSISTLQGHQSLAGGRHVSAAHNGCHWASHCTVMVWWDFSDRSTTPEMVGDPSSRFDVDLLATRHGANTGQGLV